MLFTSQESDYILLNDSLAIKSSDYFDNRSPAYLFTNENQGKIFQSLNVQNKDILSACAGSGDFVFNAKLFGANRTDMFDISLFPKYTYEIKHQAIKNLTRAEFLRCFYHSKCFLNKPSRSKIAPHLSKTSSHLLNQTGRSTYCADWAYRISLKGEAISQSYPRRSPYLQSSKNYNILREKLSSDLSFYTTPLINLSNHLERRYDIIYLSNICQYIRNISDFEDTVVNPLTPHLKKNGKIVCYQLAGALNSWTQEELERQFDLDNKWKISTKSIADIYTRSRLMDNPDTFFILEKTR